MHPIKSFQAARWIRTANLVLAEPLVTPRGNVPTGNYVTLSISDTGTGMPSEVLEHLGEDERALTEISRVLKGGGTLAASVPRRGPELLCWALSREYRTWPGGHIRIYRPEELRAKLERGGYRIFKRHFAHALHSPYWWLKCWVGLNREDDSRVKLYHRFLVWDMMQRPALTRVLEAALQPFIGKSVVFYGIKG
mgnify:CR=1 FL=1